MLANDDLKDWLSVAFKSFQNLEAIQFVTESAEIRAPTTPKTRSSIGLETFVEPVAAPSALHRSYIFSSLFKASHTSEARLKSVDCGWIPYQALSTVGNHHDILSRLRELKLGLTVDDRSGAEVQHCANFISKALMLRTLHLDLPGSTASAQVPFLRDILQHREHWPSLRDLRLGVIATDWTTLHDFLTTHAHTLRSLELSDIAIAAESASLWKKASWITIIQFLQKSLQLQHVRLEGRLLAPRDGWITHNDQHCQARAELFVSDDEKRENCLRKRIHRYILSGGECPLQSPDRVKPENQGDYSWRYTTLRQLGLGEQ